MIRAAIAVLVLAAALAPCLAKQPQPSPAHVRAELRQILSAPEYNRTYAQKESAVDQWLLKWLGRFGAWLRGLLGIHPRGGRAASIAFACVVMAGFFALAVLLLRRVLGGMGQAAAKDTALGASHYHLPSADPLLREASSLAESGDFRGAFRCAYLASIAVLDERGAIRFHRSRTNWEYLRELDAKGLRQEEDSLRPITSDFDRKIYGGEHCSLQDYQRALETYRQLSGAAA